MQQLVALPFPSFGTRHGLDVTSCWLAVKPPQQQQSTGCARDFPRSFSSSFGVVCGVVHSPGGRPGGRWCFKSWLPTAGLRWALGFSLGDGLQIARGADTSKRCKDTTCGTAHWHNRSRSNYSDCLGLSGLPEAWLLGALFQDQPLGMSQWGTVLLFVADTRSWSKLQSPISLPVPVGRIVT